MGTGGLIGYYGLSEWWESTLTPAEREYIETLFNPLGDTRERPLTEGAPLLIVGTTATATGLVSSLVGWLRATPRDRAIRRKLRAKLVALTAAEPSVLSKHFALQVLIGEFYRDRDEDPLARTAAIEACRAQIALAPAAAVAFRLEYPAHALPRHIGYQQLAIILEKAGECAEAVTLCQDAAAAAWGGDWAKRIARCHRRMETSAAKTAHRSDGPSRSSA